MRSYLLFSPLAVVVVGSPAIVTATAGSAASSAERERIRWIGTTLRIASRGASSRPLEHLDVACDRFAEPDCSPRPAGENDPVSLSLERDRGCEACSRPRSAAESLDRERRLRQLPALRSARVILSELGEQLGLLRRRHQQETEPGGGQSRVELGACGHGGLGVDAHAAVGSGPIWWPGPGSRPIRADALDRGLERRFDHRCAGGQPDRQLAGLRPVPGETEDALLAGRSELIGIRGVEQRAVQPREHHSGRAGLRRLACLFREHDLREHLGLVHRRGPRRVRSALATRVLIRIRALDELATGGGE